MSFPLERKIRISFGLALIVLVLVGALAWWSTRHFVETYREVDHTRKVLIDIEQALVDLLTIESYGRGYLLRGDERWLDNYKDRMARMPQHIAKLRAFDSHLPDHQDRLDRFERVLERELEVLSTRVTTRTAGGLDAVLDTGLNTPGDGRLRMASLQQFLQELEQEASNRLTDRSQRAQLAASTTLVTVLVTTLLSVGLVTIAGGMVSRDFRLRQQVEENLRRSEERLRLMIDSVQDYAIVLLSPDGTVASWNPGCERITGYTSRDIVGRHFSALYPDTEARTDLPRTQLEAAASAGHVEDERWLARRDGSTYWANVVITPVRDPHNRLLGFTALARDLTARKAAEEKIQQQNIELETVNRELKAFSYSISHDLRSPLRGIDGWSMALLEDFGSKLDQRAKDYLQRIRSETQRMSRLIDDLLNLSRLSQAAMKTTRVDLSAMALTIIGRLRESQPERHVECVIQSGVQVRGDSGLISALMSNLLENAWKFTGKTPAAHIQFGLEMKDGERVFFVRDNGAGFDMAYAEKLFAPFQRMHKMSEFPGTGVGLATVQRIVTRHGGRIWAHAETGKGAAFFFTLPLEEILTSS